MVKQLQGGQRATERPRKLFTQVFGVEGTGKTAFALSHPSPLYIANFDKNMDDLLEKLPPHYEIFYEEIEHDVDLSRAVASTALRKVKELANACYARGEGTFIVDGADLFWDVVKLAKLPDDADVPNQWGPANQEMTGIFRKAEESAVQVVFSSIASSVWAGMNNETQRMKADGFKHAGRFINTKVYMFSPEDHNQPDLRPNAKQGKTHSAFISQSKMNESIIGDIVPNLSFKMLYAMVYGQPYPDADKLWKPS